MRVKYALLVSFYFLLWNQESYGQNLVPNPGFDNYSQCPFGTDQSHFCNSWGSYGNSPDYWSTCGPTLPDPGSGYQYPHSSNALMALVLYRKDPSAIPNHRELV